MSEKQAPATPEPSTPTPAERNAQAASDQVEFLLTRSLARLAPNLRGRITSWAIAADEDYACAMWSSGLTASGLMLRCGKGGSEGVLMLVGDLADQVVPAGIGDLEFLQRLTPGILETYRSLLALPPSPSVAVRFGGAK